jgi:hypothetical protein
MISNTHALVVLYPIANKISGTLKEGKLYIVAAKDAGLRRVVPGKWDGKHFIGFDGLRVVNVTWWGNYPTHPDNSDSKRW